MESSYTQEDYIRAIGEADASGDAAALNELLFEFEQRWPDWEPQTAAKVPEEEFVVSVGGAEISASDLSSVVDPLKKYMERVEGFSMDEPLRGGAEEVSRRMERLTGGEYVAPRAENIVRAATGISESIRRGGEIIMSGIAVVAPEAVKEGLAEAWAKVKDKPVMQTAANKVIEGFEAYKAWASRYPREAEAFETFVDISAMYSPKPKPDISAQAKKAEKLSADVLRQKKLDAIYKVMAPRKTGEAGYEGKWVAKNDMLDSNVYQPHPREVAVREAMASIEDLNPSSNYVAMENSVSRAIEKEGQDVVKFIQEYGNPKLNRKATKAFLESRFLDISDAYGAINLSEQAQSKVREYTELALKIIDKNKSDVMGLYDARKQFDKVVNQLNPSGVLDPTIESAKGVAASHVRGVINELIKEAMPGDKVASSFDRMHNLYRARDHLKIRSFGLADNSIKRAWSKFSSKFNLPSTPLALAATVGGAASVAAVAGITPAAIMTGAGAALPIAVIVSAMSKPKRVKFYAELLKYVDKGIKSYTGEKNIVRELKADRAVILSLLDQARASEEEAQPSQ